VPQELVLGALLFFFLSDGLVADGTGRHMADRRWQSSPRTGSYEAGTKFGEGKRRGAARAEAGLSIECTRCCYCMGGERE
jgi:hypothetical protein